MTAYVLITREIERLEGQVVKWHEERVQNLRRVEEIDSFLSLVGDELRDLREGRSAIAASNQDTKGDE